MEYAAYDNIYGLPDKSGDRKLPLAPFKRTQSVLDQMAIAKAVARIKGR